MATTLTPNKITQDEKLLIRIAKNLIESMDQVIAEELPKGTPRSEFIRRSIRFTIDNIELFKKSESASVEENTTVESVDKVNVVRDLYQQIFTYKEALLKEPQTPHTIKQVSFLIFLLAEMIFKMAEI